MNGTEAVPEQMRITVVAAVESKRVPSVQRFHSSRKLAVIRLEHEVVVVRHEAVRETAELCSRNHAIEAVEEVHAIGVEREDRLPVASPGVYVVDAAGDELSGCSSHDGSR